MNTDYITLVVIILVHKCTLSTYLRIQSWQKHVSSSFVSLLSASLLWESKHSSVAISNVEMYWCVLNNPWLNRMLSFSCFDEEFKGGEGKGDGKWTNEASIWFSLSLGLVDDVECPSLLMWLPQQQVVLEDIIAAKRELIFGLPACFPWSQI